MNEEELKSLFSQVDRTPDDETRDRALRAALAAFDETHTAAEKRENSTAGQGTPELPRLTTDISRQGSKTMNTLTTNKLTQRWLYSGLASAAVLVLAVYIALLLPQSQQSFDDVAPVGIAGADKPIDGKSQSLVLEEVVVRSRTEASEQDVSVAQVPSPAPSLRPAAPERELASRQLAPAGIATFAEAKLKKAELGDSLADNFYHEEGRDRFTEINTNPIQRVVDSPVSTFSIDVDTSSYSFVRRQLNNGVLPQKDAVRVEEMINYFPYDYALPANSSVPFSTQVSVLDSPWKAGNKLIHIGIKGYEMQGAQPRSNLVFLLDVSGSMNSPDKLPLVKQSMGLLLSRLQPEDTVAIVVYAGAAGTVLEPTPVREKHKILAALDRLNAGGSTAGAAGIRLAYQLAEQHFIKAGVNRIILATDGDFNVGINNPEELKGFVERKRESGVFLSVLGFGQGNYHDHLMQTLAQNGNGVAAYIDTLSEAQKVLVDEATSTLFPIAKDVKIQVEFNPDTVSEYRLIGYETRALAEEDFNNDAVDAGDIGAGHTVTAIYEITPTGSNSGAFSPSRYKPASPANGNGSEYAYLKLRYKLPDADTSQLIEQPIAVNQDNDSLALREARFATAVAGFAELLRGGKYTGSWQYEDALTLAQKNKGDDPFGYRTELVQLIRKASVAQDM